MKTIGACVLAAVSAAWASAPAQEQPRPGRFLVVVVDDLHLEFRSTPRVRDLLQHTLRAVTHEGDSVALVSTGPSSVAVAPTRDLARILSGIRRITGDGLRAGDILDAQNASERVRRASVAIATVRQAIENAATRTTAGIAVIYVSSGYGEASLAMELAELASAANRASATIYTFEYRSLVSELEPPQAPIEDPGWTAYVREAQDSLRLLADATAGHMVSSRWEFDALVMQFAR
jgi:hypothetical protein